MFPLKTRKIGGYQFGQPTTYGVAHKGTDYKADHVPYYAPFDGVAVQGQTTGGGTYWQLTRLNGEVFTARHLSKIIKTGQVKEGEQVAVTGNTGTLTSGPHLHQEVKVNGQLVDPENYNWISLMFPIHLKVQLVFNNQQYVSEASLLAQAKGRMEFLTGGKLTLDFLSPIYTNFQNIPASLYLDFSGSDTAVNKDWLIDNTWSLNKTADVVVLVGKPGDWQNTHDHTTTYGHYYSEFPATFPALVQIVAAENDTSWKWPMNAFIHYLTHEISHSLFQNAGAVDQTHIFDYASVDGLAQALPNLEYNKINYQLTHKISYERNAAVFIQKENDPTIFLNEADVLVPFSASYESFLADFPNAKVIKVTPNEFLKFRIANKVVIKDR